jgi:hypothetical protein
MYEDGLPDGWEFICDGDCKLAYCTGDYCPDCLSSWQEYIKRCWAGWMKYVRFRGNKTPDSISNDATEETRLP